MILIWVELVTLGHVISLQVRENLDGEQAEIDAKADKRSIEDQSGFECAPLSPAVHELESGGDRVRGNRNSIEMR